MPSVFDKETYVLHYENLQLYIRSRLKLKIVYPILEFNQSQWLKKTQESIEAQKMKRKLETYCKN